MQGTDRGIIFVRAGIALAIAVLGCAVGCRQVNTFPPVSGTVAHAQPENRPVGQPAAAFPAGATAPLPSGQTVEVHRFPLDDSQNPSPLFDQIAEEPGLIDCRLTEFLSTDVPPGFRDENVPPPNIGNATQVLSQMADPPSGATTGLPQVTPGQPVDRSFSARCHDISASTWDNVLHDYSNYYTLNTASQFVIVLAPAAVFANTSLDQDVRNWYQDHIRTTSTNNAADYWRQLGNGYYTIPAYVAADLIGQYFDDVPGMGLLGEFGDRTVRAMAVGAPPLLAVQYLTGGARPSATLDHSYWRPFHASNGASGHSFMGSLPFLTLAGMTDDPWAKCLFYACSPWTGLSRINDDKHYLSQVWLGWWLSFMATESVYNTEKQKGPFVVTPIYSPDMTGVGVIYQH